MLATRARGTASASPVPARRVARASPRTHVRSPRLLRRRGLRVALFPGRQRLPVLLQRVGIQVVDADRATALAAFLRQRLFRGLRSRIVGDGGRGMGRIVVHDAQPSSGIRSSASAMARVGRRCRLAVNQTGLRWPATRQLYPCRTRGECPAGASRCPAPDRSTADSARVRGASSRWFCTAPRPMRW